MDGHGVETFVSGQARRRNQPRPAVGVLQFREPHLQPAGRGAQNDAGIAVRQSGSSVVAGHEDRPAGIELVVGRCQAAGAQSPLHGSVEPLGAERADPVGAQDAEPREQPGPVRGRRAHALQGAQQRREMRVREFGRQPLERPGVG